MKNFALVIVLTLNVFFTDAQETHEKRLCVIDSISLLSDAEKTKLTEQILDLESTVGSQIAILAIDTLNGESIESFSLRTANSWGLGRNEYNDGLLITIAFRDRKIRIEVGYGLENIIKDEIAARIIREDIVLYFRNGKYFEGLYHAVDNIVRLIKDNQHLLEKH